MTVPANGEYRIVPLESAHRDALVDFLGESAFTDNPAWASCYCQFHLDDPREVDWDATTAARNREVACSRIDARIMQGHLAFAGDDVVGWCGAGPRANYGSLPATPVEDEASVGAIVCFVVAPGHRRKGIASALLSATLDDFRTRGLEVAEAYPSRDAETDSANFHGALAMYLAAGFAPFEKRSDGTTVVRLQLASR